MTTRKPPIRPTDALNRRAVAVAQAHHDPAPEAREVAALEALPPQADTCHFCEATDQLRWHNGALRCARHAHVRTAHS